MTTYLPKTEPNFDEFGPTDSLKPIGDIAAKIINSTLEKQGQENER